MEDEFDVAFMNCGCGWSADALNRSGRPPLAIRLADAFDHVRDAWQDATPAEREEFWDWLCPSPPKPKIKRTTAKANRSDSSLK